MNGPPKTLDRRRRRQLLVALNAAETLSHEDALRLARDPPGWLGKGGRKAAGETAGVTASAIATGREVARSAARVYRDEERSARDAGAGILIRGDGEFPPSFDDLELPPAVLYRRGRLPGAPAVAIVGSRRADVYGLEVAERLAAELAAAGLVVVSGFAIGIDAAAHRGALAGGGPTVAVLGCGVDVLYPRSHRRLRERVARQGALVSEFRMGTAPEPYRFPIRNRLIAALAVGTLVVRATPRSGSLITARLALELGRDVWAVPGNISDRRSVGTNSLIRDGALPVQKASDVLESLPVGIQDRLEPPARRSTKTEESAGGSELLRHLPPGEPVSQDRLIAQSGRPAEEVIAELLKLELDGRLRRYPGPSYCRLPP